MIRKNEDMPGKQLLCPICESKCPSRRFSEFPLIKKDISPIPLPFQDIPIPLPPENPKLTQKIHKYLIKTPQVKRKAFENLEFLEQEQPKVPAPHTPPPPTSMPPSSIDRVNIDIGNLALPSSPLPSASLPLPPPSASSLSPPPS